MERKKVKSNGRPPDYKKQSKEEPQLSKSNIFPRHVQYIVFAVTMVIRIYYVCQIKNWWVLHPDEIYQSVEVAHTELYGYGFRPYEYLTSVPGQNNTRLRQRELQLGMMAMRSFIYPTFFITVSKLAFFLGFSTRPFLLWKICHGVVTSFLPLSIYMFSKSVFKSHDVGVLACVLAAGSVHLNVFGTHTLVNSFLAPFVFMSLSVILSTLAAPDKAAEHHKHLTSNFPTITFQNIVVKTVSLLKTFGILPSGIHGMKKQSKIVIANIDPPSQSEKNVSGFRLQVVFTKHLLLAGASFVLTTSCYVRPDLVVFCGTIILTFGWSNIQTYQLYAILDFLFGFIISIVLSVWSDFIHYGFGVISPWNWFKFNILTNYSGALFGVTSATFYAKIMFSECAMNLILLIVIVTMFVCELKSKRHNKIDIYMDLKLIFVLSVLLVVYSLQKHKEPRHVHNLFCLFYIIASRIVIQFFQSRCHGDTSRKYIAIAIALWIFSAYRKFPSPTDNSNLPWVYGKTHNSNEINTCLHYVGLRNDVTGVFMDRSVHVTGGYSILHQNVPILTLMIHEFNEFDEQSRITVNPKITVSTFSRASNFVSVLNAPYLLKYLIKKSKYNYLIVKENRKVINIGYKEVFRSGKMKVLKRTFKDEQKLFNMEANIPLGSNATILNYEGNMLFDLGATELATERLEASLKLDPLLINNYQLLSHIHHSMGNNQQAISVMSQCVNIYDNVTCMTRVSPRLLHTTYDISI